MGAHPVAVAADVDDVAVVQQPIDQRRGHHLVAEHLPPLTWRPRPAASSESAEPPDDLVIEARLTSMVAILPSAVVRLIA